MSESPQKGMRLNQNEQATLLRLLTESSAAGSAAWHTFWQDLLGQPTAPGNGVEELVSVFEEGLALQGATDLEAEAAIDRWIRVVVEAGRSRGIDSGDLLERLLARQARKQLGQRDQARPQSCRTRERILTAALEVFSAKGFHGATVDEIAERAGLGKGTVYRHFDSKKRLFSELIRAKVAELEQTVSGAIDPQANVLEIIETYLRVYFAFFDRNHKLYRVLIQEQSDFGAEVKALYIGNILKKVPLLKRKIYQAGRDGRLKRMNFHTVFYGVMGFIDGVMQKWLASDGGYSLVDEVPTVLETVFYGFVNPE
jgi:AcrR family transcriptional regulator